MTAAVDFLANPPPPPGHPGGEEQTYGGAYYIIFPGTPDPPVYACPMAVGDDAWGRRRESVRLKGGSTGHIGGVTVTVVAHPNGDQIERRRLDVSSRQTKRLFFGAKRASLRAYIIPPYQIITGPLPKRSSNNGNVVYV